jgi:hypothetical protein
MRAVVACLYCREEKLRLKEDKNLELSVLARRRVDERLR